MHRVIDINSVDLSLPATHRRQIFNSQHPTLQRWNARVLVSHWESLALDAWAQAVATGCDSNLNGTVILYHLKNFIFVRLSQILNCHWDSLTCVDRCAFALARHHTHHRHLGDPCCGCLHLQFSYGQICRFWQSRLICFSERAWIGD